MATERNEDLSLPAANSREIPWQSRRVKRVSDEIDSRDLPRTYNFVQSKTPTAPHIPPSVSCRGIKFENVDATRERTLPPCRRDGAFRDQATTRRKILYIGRVSRSTSRTRERPTAVPTARTEKVAAAAGLRPFGETSDRPRVHAFERIGGEESRDCSTRPNETVRRTAALKGLGWRDKFRGSSGIIY